MKIKLSFRKAAAALISAALLLTSVQVPMFQSAIAAAESTVTITSSQGAFESANVKWSPLEGAESYNVYVKPVDGEYTKLDGYLVRKYPDYYVADAVGLAKGSYVLKVVPVSKGAEMTAAASETPVLNVENYTREGFAFSAVSPNGSANGGYNADGTPKADADIVYVTNANKDTVELNGQKGIVNIISAHKNSAKPLIVRFLGKVERPADAVTYILRIQDQRDITVEGIGEDACFHGWSPAIKRAQNVEIRNLGLLWWGDGVDADAMGMEDSNYNIWIHNNDFFYGRAGQDADQKKGDGCIDMKQKTDYVTISYNHFYDTGKTSFSGGQWELDHRYDPDAKVNVTYHHNWFDHADSRHPRCVVGNTHVYNNLYSGNGYGAAACVDESMFVEGNYFEKTDRPMMIGSQGSDSYRGSGEFSGSKNLSNQDGGMIKEYNNYMTGHTTFFNQNNTPVKGQIDAYSVTAPKEQVPSTVTAIKGGWAYNNFDTADTMYSYNPDTPEAAREKVISYAGRLNGGDLKWTFTDADNNQGAIIEGLQNAVKNYSSNLVSVNNGESVYVEPTTEESTTEGTTINYIDGGELKDEKVWNIANVSTEINDGIWTGEKFNAKSGSDTYYSSDGYFYNISTGFITGSSNPSPSGGKVPETGCFLGVEAPMDGVITTAIRTGGNKTTYVVDGDGNVVYTVDNIGPKNPNRFDIVRFNAVKGQKYYIYTSGSKIRIAYLGISGGSIPDTTTDSTTETTTESTTEAPKPVKKVYGDANADTKVDANDVVMVMQYVLNGTPYTNDTEYVDVNKDGKVDSEDAAMILQNSLNPSYTLPLVK